MDLSSEPRTQRSGESGRPRNRLLRCVRGSDLSVLVSAYRAGCELAKSKQELTEKSGGTDKADARELTISR
jgi:hypothetical protein